MKIVQNTFIIWGYEINYFSPREMFSFTRRVFRRWQRFILICVLRLIMLFTFTVSSKSLYSDIKFLLQITLEWIDRFEYIVYVTYRKSHTLYVTLLMLTVHAYVNNIINNWNTHNPLSRTEDVPREREKSLAVVNLTFPRAYIGKFDFIYLASVLNYHVFIKFGMIYETY